MGSYQLDEVEGDVLLVGGYGVGNVGDEALLAGLLKELSPAVEQLTIVTHDAAGTRSLHASEVPDSTTFMTVEPSKLDLTRELVDNDVFVFGGGGLFSRYQGPYAAKIPYYAMAAKALQKEIHWTAVGVYPTTPTQTVQALRLIMNQSESVSVRDPVSHRFLRESGVNDVTLVADPATKLKVDELAGRELLADQGVAVDGDVIGIAARRVLDREINGRLQATYRTVAEELVERGYEVVFIPFCRHSYESVGKDHQVCEILHEQISESSVISYDTPHEALNVVATLDGLLATRLHSMIFAVVAETPHSSIMYAPKVRSLLTQYGMADRGIELEDVSAELVLDSMEEHVL